MKSDRCVISLVRSIDNDIFILHSKNGYLMMPRAEMFTGNAFFSVNHSFDLFLLDKLHESILIARNRI